MKCSKCGAEFTDGKFCPECGFAVGATVNAETAAEIPAPEEAAPIETPAPEDAAPVDTPAPEAATPVETPAPEAAAPVEAPAPEATAEPSGTSVYATPAPTQSADGATQKKCPIKRPWLAVAIIAIVIAVAAVAACFIYSNTPAAFADAFEKTCDSVFRDNDIVEALEKIDFEKAKTNATVTLDAETFGTEKDVVVDLYAASADKAGNIKLSVGDGSETVADISAAYADDEIAVSSNLLGDTAYGAKLDDTFADNLKASVFGSDMTDEDVENIKKVIDQIKNFNKDDTVFDRFCERIKASETKTDGEYAYGEKTYNVCVYEYTVTTDDFTWLISELGLDSFTDTDDLTDLGSVVLKAYVKGRYLVKLELASEGTVIGYVDFGKDPGKDDITLKIVDGENAPVVVRKCENTSEKYYEEYSITADGATVKFSFDYTKASGSVKFTVSGDGVDVSVSGVLLLDDGIELTLDKIQGVTASIKISNQAETVKVPEYSDITELTQDDVLSLYMNAMTNVTTAEEKAKTMFGEDFVTGILSLLSGSSDSDDTDYDAYDYDDYDDYDGYDYDTDDYEYFTDDMTVTDF